MEHNIDGLIADYLTDALDPEARRDFEQRLLSEPALAAQVALERSLAGALNTHAPENRLRKNLDALAQKFDTPESLTHGWGAERSGNRISFWWLLPAGLILISGLIYWMNQNSHKPVALPPVVPPMEAPVPAKSDHPPIADNTESKHTAGKDQSLAAAFKPIPMLESYVGSQLRGGDFQVIISAPASGASFFIHSGQVPFQLTGSVDGDLPGDIVLRVLVFNNNAHNFEIFQPVARWNLEPNMDGTFNIQKSLPLHPGLHYLLIEEPASGQWLFVDRFLVK